MKKAFSLAEVLIVIAIIAILFLIIFPYYRTAQRQLALQRAANKLAQDVRKAQGMALAAEEVGGAIPRGGYGIYLTIVPSPKTSYILFADQNSNYEYDDGERIEPEIYLESGVKIQNVTRGRGDGLNIIFSPPDPTISFSDENGARLDEGQVRVSISSLDETIIKTIIVNRAGLIYVE